MAGIKKVRNYNPKRFPKYVIRHLSHQIIHYSKTMRTITLLLILLLFSWISRGQEQPENKLNHIKTFIGFSAGKWKDEGYSPLTYDMQTISFELLYQREIEQNDYFEMQMRTELGVLDYQENTNLSSDLVAFSFSTAYWLHLKERKSKTFWIGPQYRLSTNLVTWEDEYGLSSSYTYQNSHTVSAAALFNLDFKKWSFQSRAELPLLAFNARPPYSRFNGSESGLFNFGDGLWTSLNAYVAPQVELGAEYQVFNWLNINAKMRMLYSNYHKGSRISYITNTFFVGAHINI
jgi:hypothetical protein